MPGSLEAKARGKYLEGRITEHMYHAGIGILNLDSALAFYGDKLGFVEFWRGGPADIYEKSVWFQPADRGNARRLRGIDAALWSANTAAVRLAAAHLPGGACKWDETRSNGATMKDKSWKRTSGDRKWQLNLFDPDGTRTERIDPQAHPPSQG